MDDLPSLSIRRSLKARRFRIVVRPEAVELVVPPGMSERDAVRFLEQNKEWVRIKLAEARQRLSLIPPKPTLIGADDTIPFQGVALSAVMVQSPGKTLAIRFHEKAGFEFHYPVGVFPTEDLLKSALFSAVRPWLVAEVDRQIQKYTVRLGLAPRYVRIKRMRSRWGSCGPRGDININWILAFMPPEILEYVVFHELCHLRHRNHSEAFWTLVATEVPEWRRCREWLKREGGRWLARFG